MDPDPDMRQDISFILQEPSSTIDLLWADCDLEALWHDMSEEMQERPRYKLAA